MVTSKGRLTVLREVRTALKLHQGYQLQIELTPNGFQATVVRRPTAVALQGVLRSSVKYAGEKAEWQAIGKLLGDEYQRS